MKDWKTFVKAGRAKFTLKDKISGKRYTFRVNKSHDKNSDLYFVSVLTGSDNVNDYSYLGLLDENGFRETHRSHIGYRAHGTRDAFVWFHRLVEVMNSDDDLALNMEFYHAGYCGRCGRLLTVPSSITSGYGPECIVHMSSILYGSSGNEDVYENNAKELRKLMKLAAQLKD